MENLPIKTISQVAISLPAGIEMSCVPGKNRRYDAVQIGAAGDYNGLAWFELRCQMEDRGYLVNRPAYWHKGAWRLRFKPAPHRANALQKLRPFRQWFRNWTIPPEGSPRAAAPRFDGEFFGNWVRRLTALGGFSTIFAVLALTTIKLTQTRLADPEAWDLEKSAAGFLNLLQIAEGLVAFLLIAITMDLAHYTARRLYRITGWDIVLVSTILSIVILLFGAGLFFTAESARQIISELDMLSSSPGN